MFVTDADRQRIFEQALAKVAPQAPEPTSKQASYRKRLKEQGLCPHCGGEPEPGYEVCAVRRQAKRGAYARGQAGQLADVLRKLIPAEFDPALEPGPDLDDHVYVLTLLLFDVRWKTMARALGMDLARAAPMRERLFSVPGIKDIIGEGECGALHLALGVLLARGDVVYCGNDTWRAAEAADITRPAPLPGTPADRSGGQPMTER